LKSRLLNYAMNFSISGLIRKVCIKRSRTQINFLHISKTGGTYLKSRIKILNATSDKYYFEALGHATKVRDLPPSDLFFLTVRDPISRFYSAFYARKKGFLAGNPRPAGEEWALGRFLEANDLAEALSPGHKNADEALLGMEKIKHLNRPMFDNFAGGLEKKPIFIIRQENLNRDFHRFLSLLECDYPPGFLSVESKLNVTGYEEFGAEPLSDVARANLKSWYSKDYILMSYFSKIMAGHWD